MTKKTHHHIACGSWSIVSVFVLDLLCTKYRGRQHCVGNGIGLRVGNAYDGNGNAWSESLAPLLIQITQYILKRFRLYMRNYQNSIIISLNSDVCLHRPRQLEWLVISFL